MPTDTREIAHIGWGYGGSLESWREIGEVLKLHSSVDTIRRDVYTAVLREDLPYLFSD